MDIQEPKQNWLTRLAERLWIICPEKSKIQFDHRGICITWYYKDGDTAKGSATWEEVREAVAFKRDCYAVDQICLGLVTPDGSLVATEGMEGWQALIEQLPVHLPGTPSWQDWVARVMHPPFATCWTPIFSRERQEVFD